MTRWCATVLKTAAQLSENKCNIEKEARGRGDEESGERVAKPLAHTVSMAKY